MFYAQALWKSQRKGHCYPGTSSLRGVPMSSYPCKVLKHGFVLRLESSSCRSLLTSGVSCSHKTKYHHSQAQERAVRVLVRMIPSTSYWLFGNYWRLSCPDSPAYFAMHSSAWLCPALGLWLWRTTPSPWLPARSCYPNDANLPFMPSPIARGVLLGQL